MDATTHPIFLISGDRDAEARCRSVAGPARLVQAVADPASVAAGDGYAIMVIEHRPPDLDAQSVLARLGDLPGRRRLHVLVADPGADQENFAAVDAGADDYVADALDGDEFAYRLRAADGALDDLESRGGNSQGPDAAAAPLDAAELAPSGDPEAILTAAAREAARLAGGDAAFVFRFQDSVAITAGAWGVEQPAPGAVFELLEEGCLPEARRNDAPAVVNLRPRPLGREQSIVSFIRPVYRSGAAVPLRLGAAVWGAMMVGRTGNTPFDDGEVADLAVFADRAAVTIGISDRRARLDRLRDSDLLTGLLRREALERRLDTDALGREERLGIAFFRIPQLREVREAYGSSAADHLLGEVGRHLAMLRRGGDHQARWADDEFVWILPGASGALAREAGEEAQRLVDGARLGRLGALGIQMAAIAAPAGAAASCATLVARARSGLGLSV